MKKGLGGSGACKCCGYVGFVNIFDYCWPCWDNGCHCGENPQQYGHSGKGKKNCPGLNKQNPYKNPNFKDETLKTINNWQLANPDKELMNLPEMQPEGKMIKDWLQEIEKIREKNRFKLLRKWIKI